MHLNSWGVLCNLATSRLQSNSQEQPDNTTCILKDNAEAALGSGSSILMLTWDGNLIVPAGPKAEIGGTGCGVLTLRSGKRSHSPRTKAVLLESLRPEHHWPSHLSGKVQPHHRWLGDFFEGGRCCASRCRTVHPCTRVWRCSQRWMLKIL